MGFFQSVRQSHLKRAGRYGPKRRGGGGIGAPQRELCKGRRDHTGNVVDQGCGMARFRVWRPEHREYVYHPYPGVPPEAYCETCVRLFRRGHAGGDPDAPIKSGRALDFDRGLEQRREDEAWETPS